MKRTLWLIPLLALFTLLSAGCYTKFYRPGMETAGNGPYDTLYNRNDSTAIDTTLTADTSTYYDTYPDRWYYWGRPRGYTRWGFDFYNFSPDYYWSYYGYNDYYGTPWWYDWNTPWYWRNYPWGGSGGVAEPPSRRPGGGRGRDNISGGSNAQPAPAQPGSPTYAQPNNPSSPPTSKDDNASKKSGSDNTGNSNKPGGGRGR
jgi:hypothetical protein